MLEDDRAPCGAGAPLPGLVEYPSPQRQPPRPVSALLGEFEAEVDELLARQHLELRRRLRALVAAAADNQTSEDENPLRAAGVGDPDAAAAAARLPGELQSVSTQPARMQTTTTPDQPIYTHEGTRSVLSDNNSDFDDVAHVDNTPSGGLKSFNASMHLAKRSRETDWRAKLLRFTSASHYEIANSFVILVNAVFIAWETNHSAKQAPAKGGGAHFDALMFVFCALFAADVAARLVAQGFRFFYSVDWKWNLFDVVVVTGAFIEVIAYCLESHSSVLSTSSLLRVLRLVKVMRIVRALRSIVYFRDLRITVSMLCEAVVPLMTFVFIMAMVFLVFGIFFTEGATEYVIAHGVADSTSIALRDHYGDLFVTMITLFKSITGGIDWQDASDPLERLSSIYSVVFYGYVVWSVFAMMNVVSAIFIDNTIQRSKHDREFVVQSEIQEKREFMATMDKLFVELDPDRSGTIRLEELQARIQAPRVSAYFRAIDLNPSKVKRLFQLMDSDGSGDIDRAEFKKGCDRLRGDANQLDLAILQFEVRQMAQTILAVRARLASIDEHLEAGRASRGGAL